MAYERARNIFRQAAAGAALGGPVGAFVGAGRGALMGAGVGSAPSVQTIMVEGEEIAVPEGFDPETFRRQLAAERGVMSGLERQVSEARQAIRPIEEAEQAAVGELRRQAAQALAGSQGLTRTGRGFALARSAGEQAATRETSIRGDFAQQLAGARQAAAAAETAAALERGKLVEAEQERRAGAQLAQAEVDNIIEKHKGRLFTTSGDKQRMRQEIQGLLAVETNPYAAQVYARALRNLAQGMNVPGSIDLG